MFKWITEELLSKYYKNKLLLISHGGVSSEYMTSLLNIYHTNDENPVLENIDLNTNTGVYFSHVKLGPNNNLYLGTQSGRIYRINNINNSPNATEITSNTMPLGNVTKMTKKERKIIGRWIEQGFNDQK